ncbi:FecR family protein [Niabella yanshanensis]|uniref:FecR family protein n=1 Tax=Niabella yanshanensis TaxID=577386 RepID=A0ABZ0W1C0_9BACT|nr:FecR family protein [Niabella yanshanensis]WQD37055.1 FecR family protein [Niabella yanshanensis]
MEHKLIAYYEQTLDAPEQQEVEQWIAESAEHKKTYEDTIRIWENSRINPAYKLFNKELAWQKLQQQLEENPLVNTKKAKVISLNWRKGWAVAASITALVVLFLFINNPRPEQFTAQKEQRTIILKDESKVTLYEEASLMVAKAFNKKTRTVTLKGNAYFDIAKNAAKPFIIHNNDMDVEVLGTSFTIQQGVGFNTVFVHSGKVKATLADKSVIATANQKIVKDNRNNQLRVLPFNNTINEALHTQLIKIKDMRVDSLAQMLEGLYNIELQLAPGIESKKVTSTYLIHSETPDQIVENIALMINASWIKKDHNQYLISK